MNDEELTNIEIALQLIVESIPNSVFLINEKGKIIFANSRAVSLFQILQKKLIGTDIETLIPANQHNGIISFKNIQEKSLGQTIYKEFEELHALKADGTLFPIEMDINPFFTNHQHVTLIAINDISEKKKAEEGQALLAAIVNSSEDAIISKTLDGIITSWNKGAEKIFGYKASEVIGKNISMLIPEDRTNEEPQIIEKIRKGEHVEHYETERRHKNGKSIHISLTISPVKDNSGKIIGASKIARDIGDRKKSEEQFRLVVESSPNAMILVNNKGEITLVNAETEKLFGYNRTELIGQKVEILMPEGFTGHHSEFLKAFFREPQKRAMGIGKDLFALHKNGNEFPVEIGLNPIETKEGNMVLAAVIDITERKRKDDEDKQRKIEIKFRAVLENSFDAFTLRDAWGKIIYQSPAVENIIGYTLEEMENINIADLFHPDDIPDITNRIKTTLQNQGLPIYGMHRMKHKDGHYIWTEGYSTNFLENADIKALVGNFRDITHSKVANEKIIKLNRLYSFLSYTNQALVHIREEQSLYNEVCRIAVDVGKFEMAWIGIANKHNKVIKMVAHSNATPDDEELFRNLVYDKGGPIDTILETGAYFLFNDTINDPDDPHWRAYLKRKNFRSFIALPIIKAGITVGMFNIFSSSSGFFDEKEVALLVEAANDISFALEIFNKEEEIKISELKFREFFENAPETILILDLDKGGTISGFNNNALELFKYTADKLKIQSPATLSPPLQPDGSNSRLKAMELIQAAASGKRPVFEWLARDADGKDFFCEVRLAKLSHLNCNNLIVNIIDIAERKNNEQLREKMTMDLMQRNKGLEQFMYIVSHNLRAPVANILGIANLMQNEDNDENTELIEALDTSVKRLDNVINDLNYVLQVKQGVSEKKELTTFSGIVEDIKVSIADIIASEKVVITYDFNSVDSFFTLKTYLYSVFYNLISNSIKYRQPDTNPNIEIKSSLSNNKLILTFKDNGLGIDLSKKGEEVFGLYKRFHTHLEGKGMGLYMVKTQVEIMGGHISIASEVNKGTTFTIEFDYN